MSLSRDHWTTTRRLARKFGLSRAVAYGRAVITMPEAMKAWEEFLKSHVKPVEYDGILVRILRPYMRQHFTTETKRQMLQEHLALFAPAIAKHPELAVEPGMLAAKLVGKNDATYHLCVGGNTSKEGEMSMGLYDLEGRYLARMGMTVGRDEQNQSVLWIGSMQGAKPPLGRDEVVKATRDLHGLRPKGAVMLAAQTFAGVLGLTALRAPGNEGHISQRGINRIRAKRKIYADYGQFWEEVGGTKIGEEEYSIPITPQVRDVSEVKPNKRSEWKKRQVLSEQLMADTRATLARLSLNTAATMR